MYEDLIKAMRCTAIYLTKRGEARTECNKYEECKGCPYDYTPSAIDDKITAVCWSTIGIFCTHAADAITSLLSRAEKVDKRIGELEKERDMAVEDIKKPSVCDTCQNHCQGDDDCVDNGYIYFEWRGIREESE